MSLFKNKLIFLLILVFLYLNSKSTFIKTGMLDFKSNFIFSRDIYFYFVNTKSPNVLDFSFIEDIWFSCTGLDRIVTLKIFFLLKIMLPFKWENISLNLINHYKAVFCYYFYINNIMIQQFIIIIYVTYLGYKRSYFLFIWNIHNCQCSKTGRL